MRAFIDFLATGFYIGRAAPVAPGTFGTLLGLPLFFIFARTHPLWWMGLTLLLVMVSIVICQLRENYFQSHDPKEVVLDEVVGFLVASMWLPWEPFYVVASFVLFRFFDIVKPYPIGWIDKKVKGGLGTVSDDLAAGLATNILLQIVLRWTGGGAL